MKKRNLGFTLLEVIIVLAILIALTAILVPVVSGFIGQSEAGVCAANRAEIERFYQTQMALHANDGVEVTMDKILSGKIAITGADSDDPFCPSGGTYTFDEHTGKLSCSIASHNAAKATDIPSNPTSGMLDIIHQANTGKNFASIDSGATSGEVTTNVNNLLASSNIDLSAKGAVSWAYRKNGSAETFMWSSVDIAPLANATKVPVMVYRFDTDTYTVCMATVKIKTEKLSSGVTQTYNIFDKTSEYSLSASGSASDKHDYATVYGWYQKALEEAGY